MKIKLLIILIAAVFYLTFVFTQGRSRQTNIIAEGQDASASTDCPAPGDPFPSYDEKYGPPEWWCKKNKTNIDQYPIFQIKADYPDDYESYLDPKNGSFKQCSDCDWKKYNFRDMKDMDKYLKSVVKYAFEGNLESEWVIQNNTRGRKWFHAPFMHLDIVSPKSNPSNAVQPIIDEKVGREFIHGLTLERGGSYNELNYDPKNPKKKSAREFQNWAVSFYNERGASYIGKIWNEMLDPKSGKPDPKNFPSKGFPDGTVAVKLLFTQAKPEKVPYLKDSVVWKADTADYLHESHQKTKRLKETCIVNNDCNAENDSRLSEMRLLQIDIAVRDDRQKEDEKSPTGWVFATFTYDNQAKPYIAYETPEKDRLNAWLRIVPLGLMFGNDPLVPIGGELKESLINTNLRIPQHYGCGDLSSDPKNRYRRRLNGPVDNPVSSCISCHANSETPADLNIASVPYRSMKCENQDDINYWFRNINPRISGANATMKPAFATLDYSLQLREGIRRYCLESYNNGANKCRLPPFKPGDKNTIMTKEGTIIVPIQ